MIRRRHGISLARDAQVEEDVNPNAYMVNIADCMLVLLLGTIVALISYFGVDLTKPPRDDDAIIGIEMNLDKNGDGRVDPNYEQAGTVYYDASTDSYYLVSE